MTRARLSALSVSVCLTSFLCLASHVGAQTPPPGAPAAGAPAAAPAADVGALVAQAKDAVAAKKWADAKKAAEEALKAEPANVEANAYLGLAGKGLGKCRTAVKPL